MKSGYKIGSQALQQALLVGIMFQKEQQENTFASNFASDNLN